MDTIFIDSMNMIEESSVWSKFYNVMFNTGNLVFSEYCKKQVDYQDVYKLNFEWSNADRNKVYVLPLSNNLSLDETYFTRLLYKLSKYELNVVPIGLGVQADISDTPKNYMEKIPGRKKRLFQKLAYNSVTIGVRGEFTAECLELLGIKNIRVIGCPSFYSNIIKSDSSVDIEFNDKYEKRICVNWDMNCRERINVKHGNIDVLCDYVLQTIPEYIKNENGKESIFFSVQEWSKWLVINNFCRAIGNRFHGNMICYLNGIPTVWCIKDMRMRELIETLGLPCISMNRQKNCCLEYEDIFNGKMYSKYFYKKREILKGKYIDFLNENGIKNNFAVELL